MDIKPTITSKLLNTLLICISIDAVFLAGYFLHGFPELTAYLYPVIVMISFVGYKISGIKFPFYFHVGLLFLLASANAEKMNVQNAAALLLIADCIACIASLIKSKQNKLAFRGKCAIKAVWIENKEKFCNILKDSKLMCAVLLNGAVLFVAAYTGYLFQDYNGYWIILSTAAVLIGEETGKTKQRGLKRFFGCLLGFGIGILLVSLQVNRIVRILVFVAALVIPCLTMPKHYVIGSMSIGLSAVMGNSLMEATLSCKLVMERFIWTILGIVIAVVASSVINIFMKGIHNKNGVTSQSMQAEKMMHEL